MAYSSKTLTASFTADEYMCGGVDGAKPADGEKEEPCNLEAWETLANSFSEVRSVLDHNHRLIQQANDNHRSKNPRNLATNIELIREINANISKVIGLYSNLSTIIQQRRSMDEKVTKGNWKFLESKNSSSKFPDLTKSNGNSVIELISTPTKITGVHYVQVEGMNSLVSELADVAAQERAMLDECESVLGSTTAMQGTAKVSLLTIGHQAIMDAYICLLHLTAGILVDDKVPTKLKKSIMQARMDKKMTQAQLS